MWKKALKYIYKPNKWNAKMWRFNATYVSTAPDLVVQAAIQREEQLAEYNPNRDALPCDN